MNIIDTKLKFNSNYATRSTSTIRRVIWHHLGVTARQTVETVHNYSKSKGYAGIDYHLYVRRDGTCYQGRPFWMIGAHTSGYNTDSIGICLEGNFQVEDPTSAQIATAQDLVEYISQTFGLNDNAHGVHKQYDQTACPGSNFILSDILNGDQKLPATVLPEMEFGVLVSDAVVFSDAGKNPLKVLSKDTDLQMTKIKNESGIDYFETQFGWVSSEWVMRTYDDFYPVVNGTITADAVVFKQPNKNPFIVIAKNETVQLSKIVKYNNVFWYLTDKGGYVDSAWVSIEHDYIDPPVSAKLVSDAVVFADPPEGAMKIVSKGSEILIKEIMRKKDLTWCNTDQGGWIDSQWIDKP